MENNSIVAIRDLKKYFGKIKAVDGLSFAVPEGTLFGFLGPNGSGKSTTLSMLAGLAKPHGGEIKLFGEDATSNVTLRERIGFMIEQPAFYGFLTAGHNLKLAARLFSKKISADRIAETLELVGLLHRADDKVKNFSQGMKQRLGLAHALLHKPELLILDEPSNGLDPEGNEEMWHILCRLVREHKTTVLVSSHLLHEVEEYCENVAVVNQGKLVAEGSVDDLIKVEDRLIDVAFVSEEDCQKAAERLSGQDWIAGIAAGEKLTQSELRINIGQQPIEKLTGWLFEQGLQTTTVVIVRQTLRNLFMSLTSQKSKTGTED